MDNIIIEGGLIDTILTALGLSSNITITDDYAFFYTLFAVVLALVFVVYFIVLLFRSFSSIFKASRL